MITTLRQPGTGRKRQLTDEQQERLLLELDKTDGAQTDPRDPLVGMAPDLLISIDDGGTVREYILYGRSVLRDPDTKRERQFYMGLLLEEWMR